MFYHDQYNQVVGDFKSGNITKEIAFKQLQIIEEKAYNSIPDAEPDGDITYAVASAVEEIERTEKAASKADTPAPKCLLCNDTGQHLVDCPLCDKSGGKS